ncbi:response regulator transcription factor [Flavobacterium sp. 3HN19-14]|uniref:response regulator transcription factor n=1 Tax=Flavobacterium sp. 3HN19-14 TaxID=3448133 RepID=UPI003EE1ECC8
MLKKDYPHDLKEALQKIINDGYYCDNILDWAIPKNGLNSNISSLPILKSLTAREIEVLKLVAAEMSSLKIADKLNISSSTVETHRKNILDKTNSKTLSER